MERLLQIVGLNQKLTPHSLRHTHTSLFLEVKVGLEEIMELFADDYVVTYRIEHEIRQVYELCDKRNEELRQTLKLCKECLKLVETIIQNRK